MLEKPEKWIDPEVYRERQTRTFRLYCDVHWTFGDRIRKPNCRPQVTRYLKPEIQEWLDAMNLPHQLRLGHSGKSKIIFERVDHAMLFKLAWI